MNIITVLLGYGMLFFMLSLIYRSTICGERKINAGQDILGLLIGIGIYVACQRLLTPVFGGTPLPGMLVDILVMAIGIAAIAILLPIVYKGFYASLPPAEDHHH